MSTVIVLTAAIVVAAWVNRDLIRIKIASVYARVAPKAGEVRHYAGAASEGLSGDAPWALSALPECLTELSKTTGPEAFVHAHLPAGAVPIAPPLSLRYGDCTVDVEKDEAFVRRGADRFRIPPRVRFYRVRGLLAMLRESAMGVELRVYEAAQP